MMARVPKSIPARIVFWQLAIAIAGAVLFGLWLGLKAAMAAFIGGAIGALLSLYFAIKIFGTNRRGNDPQAIVRTFFRAEALKLVMAAGLFSVAAIYLAEAWLPLIATFMASQFVYGFALLWKAGDGY